ncbi:hypothetical protein Hanom_Chr12g01178021 [Helianthus anomalus]
MTKIPLLINSLYNLNNPFDHIIFPKPATTSTMFKSPSAASSTAPPSQPTTTCNYLHHHHRHLPSSLSLISLLLDRVYKTASQLTKTHPQN